MRDTWPLLKHTDFPDITRRPLQILQVNLGYLCNMSCLHCHVNAGPTRKELMTAENIEHIMRICRMPGVTTLDLTGGAPELNPLFRQLVSEATELGIKIIDRCNLTVLFEPGQEDLAQFLADHKVEIVASLPCYLEENVDGQRGKGTYQKSIDALQLLNSLGYGADDGELPLTLVYNPTGPYLPPPQESLEQDYKAFLRDNFEVSFTNLFTITNMPIARFGSTLVSKGQFEDYMVLLKDAYSPDNLEGLMCRNQLSIDWQGYVYDCDFNQMLKMNLNAPARGMPLHISDIDSPDLSQLPILTADHCYGCTAGQGSSCGGALG